MTTTTTNNNNNNNNNNNKHLLLYHELLGSGDQRVHAVDGRDGYKHHAQHP